MAEKIGKFGAEGLIIIFACSATILAMWKLNNDTWFILNCGRYVIETGTIPHIEFATMHEDFDYVMDQWLTAIIFWKIFSNFGADALIFLAWILGVILILTYYKLCLFVSDGNKKISAILTFIVCLAISCKDISTSFISTRPQMFSMLILLTEIFLLEKFVHTKNKRLLYFLPLLSVACVNFHSAVFPMLIVVLMPFIAESLILNFKKISTPFLPLIFTAAGIFLAGFINPYGLGAMLYLFNSIDPNISILVAEMNAPSFGNFVNNLFFACAALMLVVYSKKSMPIRYFFLTFGLMVLAFHVSRSIFMFLILGTFPLAYAAKDFKPFDKFFNIRHKLFLPLFFICGVEFYFLCIQIENSIVEIPLSMKIIFTLAIIFLACFIFFYRREGKLFSEEIFILRRKQLIALAVFQAIIISHFVYLNFPIKDYEPHKAALDFLLSKNRAEDIILWTGYNSGGYAEFRGVKTYIDPRAEVFIPANNHKKDIFKEYCELKYGILDYAEFFSRYNFTHIFVTKIDSVPYALLSEDKEHFRLIFEYDFFDYDYPIINHGKIFVPIKK